MNTSIPTSLHLAACAIVMVFGAHTDTANAFESARYSITNFSIGTQSVSPMTSARFSLTAALGEPIEATATTSENGTEDEGGGGAHTGSKRRVPLPALPVVFNAEGIQNSTERTPIVAVQQSENPLREVAGLSRDVREDVLELPDEVGSIDDGRTKKIDDDSARTSASQLAQVASFVVANFWARLSIFLFVIALLAYVRARTRFGRRWSPF